MGNEPEQMKCTPRGRRGTLAAIAAVAALAVGACQETDPTSLQGGLIPVSPQTVEVYLPWAAFGDSVAIFGGFGSPSDLFSLVISQDYRGDLDSRRWFGSWTSQRSARCGIPRGRPDRTPPSPIWAVGSWREWTRYARSPRRPSR